MILAFIVVFGIFFALNMGGSNYAACFATSYGSKLIERRKAQLLFILFVVLGATVMGSHVSLTLGEKIIPAAVVTPKAVIVIFLSGGAGMYLANWMKIPQSTSLVTVASICGVGLYHQDINVATVARFFPYWFLLPLVSFFLTYGATHYVYPPRKANFWIYEKLVNHQDRLKVFVVICSCYNAFSVGTNNVANIVGPITAMAHFNMELSLLVFGIVFGAGAFAFGGTMKTAGSKIIPLGLLTASVISLISGTLILFASWQGIPQSFVMLQMGALFAVAALKDGKEILITNTIARKTLFTWTINPLMTLGVSYGLCHLLLR